jgi:single-strand DNA-binding protein
MSASYCKVFLLGNLTRDPELRYTPKQTPVVELALALNRVWTDQNGVKQEDTTFVDVVLWGRQAEIAGQYLRKGSPIFVEGRIQMDSWTDKQTGEKRNRLKVVGENLQLLPSKENPPPSRPPQRTREPLQRSVGAHEAGLEPPF